MDKYASFAELSRDAPDDSWRIVERQTQSGVLVIAPHGGEIEVGTSELAASIAGDEHNLYCFEGLRVHGFRELHVTSHRFDEPRALALAGKAAILVGIHGCKGHGAIYVGGLDDELVTLLTVGLCAAGFRAHSHDHTFPALHPQNICNRSLRGVGAQLELTIDLRSAQHRTRIADSVRAVIAVHYRRVLIPANAAAQ